MAIYEFTLPMMRNERYMPMWLAILVGIGVMLTLPLWIPVLVVWDAVRERQKRKAARSFACLTCERILGAEAVRLANVVWKHEMRERWKRKPWGLKRRIAPRSLHAVCPACQTRYTYIEVEKTFVVEERW